MSEVIRAVALFPTVVFTPALVTALGFWILVLLQWADVHDFDADVPSLARAFRGIPVALGASVAILSAWLVSLVGMVLMEQAGVTGPAEAVSRVGLLALSVLVAWSVTCSRAAPLARLRPGEPAPPQRDLASNAPFDPGSRHARG